MYYELTLSAKIGISYSFDKTMSCFAFVETSVLFEYHQ